MTGAGLVIQKSWCKITFKSSFGKFVGADPKNFRGFKGLSQKSVGAVAPTATPTLTWPLLAQALDAAASAR